MASRCRLGLQILDEDDSPVARESGGLDLPRRAEPALSARYWRNDYPARRRRAAIGSTKDSACDETATTVGRPRGRREHRAGYRIGLRGRVPPPRIIRPLLEVSAVASTSY